MALTLNEVMFNALGDQGYVGHLNRRLWEYFADNGASAGTQTLSGRELSCLIQQTQIFVPVTINELWFDYLGSRGYTGTVDERKYQFWVDGGTFGPVAKMRRPTRLMYDDDMVAFTVAGGAHSPTIDMNAQGAQAWTNGDPAINYIAGSGKVGFTEYEAVTITLTAQAPGT